MMFRFIYILAALVIAVVPTVGRAGTDWSDYAALLQRHLSNGEKNGVQLTLVDYPGIAADPLYPRVLKRLASQPRDALVSREERLAFYINAYNVMAIKMVVDHWPLSSIKKAGSLLRPVWKKPAGTVAGETLTLDQIEHEILRPMGEPRMHLAIVCASVSCPDLRNESYIADRLEEQLEDQSRRFLNNAGKGVRVENNDVRASKIFDWFDADFQPQGVGAFIRHFRPDLPAGPISADLHYDWSLNYLR